MIRFAALALFASALLSSAPGACAEPLAPFVATYEVHYGGKRIGNATMRVVHDDASRWRVDLDVRGDRGLAGLARLNLQQSTLFDLAGGGYRPLTQATVRHALLGSRKRVGTYDWAAGNARWEGDIERRRRAAVPLQPGDMSGLLINLAVIRDAQPGRQLEYRFVDDGRARQHRYQVSGEPETVTAGDLGYQALRVQRLQADGDATVLWVADGVPTPVRILQREDGKDAMDLRLLEYQGVQ